MPVHKRRNKKKYEIIVNVFVSKKKKLVLLAFENSLMSYPFFDEIIHFVYKEWEQRKCFFEDYEMIYPCVITSLHWKFDYVFFFQRIKKCKSVNTNY